MAIKKTKLSNQQSSIQFLQASDFPDLVENIFSISTSHFETGLDINALVDDTGYLYVPNVVFSFKPKHILFTIFEKLIQKRSDQSPTELYNFAKKSLSKIDSQYLIHIAFYALKNQQNLDLIAHLVKNNLIDINTQYKGYTLLMGTNEKKKIDKLMELGADISVVGNEPNSATYQKTAYDMALLSKSKNWISHLKPYVPSDVLNSASKERIVEFKATKEVKKQLKIYCLSLKEKDSTIAYEIIANQDKYKELISYRDKLNKNLLSYAMDNTDILKKLLSIQYYQDNRHETVSQKNQNFCYTIDAIYLQKKDAAKLFYENDFKDDKELNHYLTNQEYVAVPELLKLMIDNGYKPSLDARINNLCDYKIGNDTFTKEQIENFFDKHGYLLKMADMYNNGNFINYTFNYMSRGYLVKADHIKILAEVLSQQKLIDKPGFDSNFKKVLGGLGQNPKHIGLKFGSVIMHKFPKEDLLDWLGAYGQQEWLIKLNKNNLQDELDKIEDKQDDNLAHRKVKI